MHRCIHLVTAQNIRYRSVLGRLRIVPRLVQKCAALKRERVSLKYSSRIRGRQKKYLRGFFFFGTLRFCSGSSCHLQEVGREWNRGKDNKSSTGVSAHCGAFQCGSTLGHFHTYYKLAPLSKRKPSWQCWSLRKHISAGVEIASNTVLHGWIYCLYPQSSLTYLFSYVHPGCLSLRTGSRVEAAPGGRQPLAAFVCTWHQSEAPLTTRSCCFFGATNSLLLSSVRCIWMLYRKQMLTLMWIWITVP